MYLQRFPLYFPAVNQNEIRLREGTTSEYKMQRTSHQANNIFKFIHYSMLTGRLILFILPPYFVFCPTGGIVAKLHQEEKNDSFYSPRIKKSHSSNLSWGQKKAGWGLTGAQPFAQLKANRLMDFKSLLPKHSFSFPKLCWLRGTGSCVCPRHAVKDVHF